jgi:hypothetical protein
VAQRCFRCRPDQRQRPELRCVAARNPGHPIGSVWGGPVACAGIVVPRVHEAPDACVPHSVWRQRVGELAERYRRDRRILSLSRGERCDSGWNLRIDPELVMKTLKELETGCQLPRELPEDLVLLVFSRQRRIGPRLTVVVTKVLVSGKKPEPIAGDRAAKVACGVAIPITFVPRLRAAGDGQQDRLARERRRLRVIRRVVLEAIAPLSRDDIEDGALDVSILGRHSDRLDLDLLNHVNTRLGPSDAGARTREVGAVYKEQVLVATGPKSRHRVHGAARR